MLGAWGCFASFGGLYLWATGPVDDPISLALMGLGVGWITAHIYMDHTIRRLELKQSSHIGWPRK